jgi:hypothetical protein
MGPTKRAAILVLGMHRSGTSCLAHLLNLLGAKLPERLVGPGYGNLLGHWEPARLMEINDEILGAIGRSWHDPRPIPSSWFRSKAAYAFHERLSAAIASGYGNAHLFLIKDPRICRLATLYIEVLDSLAIEPLVVLPVRHPVEIIRSLYERDHVDRCTIEFLWLRYVLEAEEASRSCVRVWTSFEDVLANWITAVQSIAHGLGIVWPNGPEKVAGEVTTFLRPRHRHCTVGDDAAPVPLGHLTTRAWEAAQHCLNGNEAVARSTFDKISAAIKELDRLGCPRHELIEKRLSAAESGRHTEVACREKNQQLEAEISLANDRIACLTAALEELNRRVATMQASGS